MEYFIHNLNFNNIFVNKQLNVCDYQFCKLSTPKIFEPPFYDIITYNAIYTSLKPEQPSCLYQNKKKTALDDICLILSLITNYDVQYTDSISKTLTQIDPRKSNLDSLSSSFLISFQNNNFTEKLQIVLAIIQNDKWLKKYNNGSHLLLMKEAMKKQSRESQFLNCWIIWEHLFYLLNKNWISEETLKHKISSHDKISYLLTQFGIKECILKKEHKNIQKLALIRNSIVHKGMQPEFHSYPKEYWLFFELTQIIVAKTINFTPYDDIYDTNKKFKQFLRDGKY